MAIVVTGTIAAVGLGALFVTIPFFNLPDSSSTPTQSQVAAASTTELPSVDGLPLSEGVSILLDSTSKVVAYQDASDQKRDVALSDPWVIVDVKVTKKRVIALALPADEAAGFSAASDSR